ncbi:restriction endonuclease subunit S [Chachezhania sediminis]|uniref:restriction endonuclease subunit S n=1 Tax=Chachezhania sediminis TaxID=2599291 RepID=UPI00131DA6AF|nr:restriction endonuclease subunit S [Chachezhania sediminis]
MNQVSDLVSRWHIGRIHPTPDLEPDGWTLEKLCDIAKLESGHTPSRKRPDYWDGGIPWLSLHDSKTIEGKVLHDTKMTVSALGLANSSARLLPEGTVALSRTATIGKVAVMGRQMATSQDFACYVCGPRLHNRYLAHLFRGMADEWDRLMAGSTHNTIYMPTFENMQILVPPMEEQEAIAEALSDADALIEGLERLIAKKRLIKQGAMQDLLTAKRRLPGFSGEWVKTNLRKLLKSTPTYGINSAACALGSGGYDYLRITDIDEHGQLRQDGRAEVLHPSATHYFLEPDEIVVARTGASTGKSHQYTGPKERTVYAGFLIKLAPAITEVVPSYLFQFLQTDAYWSWIGENSVRSGQPGINGQQLSGMTLLVPQDLKEQKAIAEVLGDMDAEIQALDTRLEKARQVKEGMMQNLLTGRIRLV